MAEIIIPAFAASPKEAVRSEAFVAGFNARYRSATKPKLRKFKDASEADIIRFRRSVKHLCGVYFLININKIVYVGQSVNIIARVSEHAKGAKVFDSFSYLECHPDQLDGWERAYINKIMPPLNNDTETRRIRCKTISSARLDEETTCSENRKPLEIMVLLEGIELSTSPLPRVSLAA